MKYIKKIKKIHTTVKSMHEMKTFYSESKIFFKKYRFKLTEVFFYLERETLFCFSLLSLSLVILCYSNTYFLYDSNI